MARPAVIPTEQAQAFHRAMCVRLNLDPNQVSQSGFAVEAMSGGQAEITWTGIAFLPEEEVRRMINAAGAGPVTHYHSTPPGQPDRPCTQEH